MSEQNSGANVSIDYKLPLWGIVSAVGGGFVLLVGLFYNVSTLSQNSKDAAANLKDLQIAVQAGNTANASVAARTQLLEWRVDTNTADLKVLMRQSKGGK